MKNAVKGPTRDIAASVQWSVLLVFLVLSNLHDAAAVSLGLGTVRGFPGNKIEVPLFIRYASNELREVVAFQADLRFDSSGIADGPPGSGTISTRHTLASSQLAPGIRRVLVYSVENAVLTNGTIATVPFTVQPMEYRNFTLVLTNVILVRADASRVAATNINGLIALSQVFVAPDGHADGFLNVVSNAVDECYVIQATTDLVTWVNVQTNNATGNLLTFAETGAAAFPHRFYRAILCSAAASPRIAAIAELANGRVRFDFSRVNGKSYVVQASTNLIQWDNVRTNAATAESIVFTDSVTNYPHRFYRVTPER
jgi:hypothetical protein